MIIVYSILAGANFILFGMLFGLICLRRSEGIKVAPFEYFNSLVCFFMGIFILVCLINAASV